MLSFATIGRDKVGSDVVLKASDIHQGSNCRRDCTMEHPTQNAIVDDLAMRWLALMSVCEFSDTIDDTLTESVPLTITSVDFWSEYADYIGASD